MKAPAPPKPRAGMLKAALVWGYAVAVCYLGACLLYVEYVDFPRAEAEAQRLFPTTNREAAELVTATKARQEQIVSNWLDQRDAGLAITASRYCAMNDLSSCTAERVELAIEEGMENSIGGPMWAPFRWISETCYYAAHNDCPLGIRLIGYSGWRAHLKEILAAHDRDYRQPVWRVRVGPDAMFADGEQLVPDRPMRMSEAVALAMDLAEKHPSWALWVEDIGDSERHIFYSPRAMEASRQRNGTGIEP